MATLQDLQEIFAERSPLDVAILVNGATGFRTTRLEDLTQPEIDRIYKTYCPTEAELDAEFSSIKKDLKKRIETEDLKKWRSKILAIAEKTGIKEPGSFTKFNGWMLKYSIHKKQLTDYTLDELKELHRQFNKLKDNNTNSALVPFTKEWWKKGNEIKNLN